MAVCHNGSDNQIKQNEQPYKGEQEPPEIKEENAPEEVEYKADGVVGQSFGGFLWIFFFV